MTAVSGATLVLSCCSSENDCIKHPHQRRDLARVVPVASNGLRATSTSHRRKVQKEQDDLKKQQSELLAFEEKLKHAADRRIKLDLDDGVKVNYGKFGDLLTEVKAVCGAKEED
jgi:hypothetical protein